ncbi:hypothetical protein OQA88_10537 [Cercophora sp. LCS_1]
MVRSKRSYNAAFPVPAYYDDDIPQGRRGRVSKRVRIEGQNVLVSLPKSPQQMVDDINRLKTPTYFCPERAWSVLGWGATPSVMPQAADFQRGVDALWRYIRSVRSRDGNRARAAILDALRTLNIQNRSWHVGTVDLKVSNLTLTNFTSPPYVLPGTGSRAAEDARDYLATGLTEKVEQAEMDGAKDHSRLLWLRYHRYQGFMAADPEWDQHRPAPGVGNMLRERRFRAVPVPHGPNSLWHSLSYFRGARRRRSADSFEIAKGPDIFSHWTVKARIWTYYFQVLCDPGHERWRAYHWLEDMSTCHDFPDYGTLSIGRSLCASSRQGLPAYSAYWILWVIADYFGVEIIVFYPPTVPNLQQGHFQEHLGRWGGGAGGDDDTGTKEVESRDEQVLHPSEAQSTHEYRWHAFGHKPTYPKEPNFGKSERDMPYGDQIFLVTDDWMNFDPAEPDYCALYRKPMYEGSNTYTTAETIALREEDGEEIDPEHIEPEPPRYFLTPPDPGPDVTGSLLQDGPGGLPPAWPDPYTHVFGAPPSDRPPCQLARYNFLRRREVDHIRANRNGVLTSRIILPEQLNGVTGPLADANLVPATQQNLDHVRPRLRVLDAFKADRDIDLPMFERPGYQFVRKPQELPVRNQKTSQQAVQELMQQQQQGIAPNRGNCVFDHQLSNDWEWRFGENPLRLGVQGPPPRTTSIVEGRQRVDFPWVDMGNLEHRDGLGEEFYPAGTTFVGGGGDGGV